MKKLLQIARHSERPVQCHQAQTINSLLSYRVQMHPSDPRSLPWRTWKPPRLCRKDGLLFKEWTQVTSGPGPTWISASSLCPHSTHAPEVSRKSLCLRQTGPLVQGSDIDFGGHLLVPIEIACSSCVHVRAQRSSVGQNECDGKTVSP